MAYSTKVSSKQTSYNVVAPVIAALVSTGVIEDQEAAFDALQAEAAKVFADLSETVAEEQAQEATRTATKKAATEARGSGKDFTVNFGKFKGSTLEQIDALTPEQADALAVQNGKEPNGKPGREWLEWVLRQENRKEYNLIRRETQAYMDGIKAGV